MVVGSGVAWIPAQAFGLSGMTLMAGGGGWDVVPASSGDCVDIPLRHSGARVAGTRNPWWLGWALREFRLRPSACPE